MAAVLTLGASPQANADPLAICQAANPQFPQLCPCTLERASAAGFDEPALSALLGHVYTSATPEQVQIFGLIFVECTQAAVAGNLTPFAIPKANDFIGQNHDQAGQAVTEPAAPVTTQNSPATGTGTAQPDIAAVSPQPNATTQPTDTIELFFPPALGAPVLPAEASEQQPDTRPAKAYQFEFSPNGPKQIGPWVPFVQIKTFHPWASWGPAIANGGGVFDASGAFLVAECSVDRAPVLTVGPVAGTHVFRTGVVRVRGSGGTLLEQFSQPARIEGDLLQFTMGRGVLDALRRGASVEIEAIAARNSDPAARFSFGLTGSSRAIAKQVCDNPAGRVGVGYELVSGDWEKRYEKLSDGLSGPIVRFARPGRFERPALRCDGRLEIRDLDVPFFEPGSAPGYEQAPNYALQIDGGRIYEVQFQRKSNFTNEATTKAPLPTDLLAKLRTGGALYVYPLLAAPGGGTYRAFNLMGLGTHITDLTCPANLPQTAQAITDLTTIQGAWVGEDLAPILFGQDPNAERLPFAALSFSTGQNANVPGLALDCQGVPFFFENFGANSSTFDVRFVVNGDEARGTVVEYLNYRSIFNPGDVVDGFGQTVLNGTTLRVTSLANPGVDVLYPLTGARAALVQAGCVG
ncbi:MAG: hypothetical protein AAF727_05945 [Pseudomonadota bacterium]